MPRIADILERESRTVDLEQGDFERLLVRRGRKQRNARIRAGALGVIVTLAMGVVLVRSLTTDAIPASPPVEPAPAPLSGAIAYDLQGRIYVAGPDGSNPVALADVVAINERCPGEVFARFPSWSPDGQYLAFDRMCADRNLTEVVIADLQGNVVQSLRVAQAYPLPMAWSPDSTRVAVWDEYHFRESSYTIGVHGIDGSHETFAMPSGWGATASGDLIWAPDGASLIVSELEVPLDGGSPREIPFHGTFLDRSGGFWRGALAYSPDGSQMAYGTPEGLMVARADGSDHRVVSDDGAHTAAWSPDGELIAVASNGDDAGNVPGGEENYDGKRITEQSPNRLRVVNVATGATTLLSEGAWFTVIGFSPDGDRVLYGEHRPVEGQPDTSLDSIWSIGIDGSDARQIVAGTSTGDLRPT